MKAKQLLLIALIVLLSASLLFGGVVHSSLHADGGGAHGESPCQVCALTLLEAAVDFPPLACGSAFEPLRLLPPSDPLLAHVLPEASPRAPPA